MPKPPVQGTFSLAARLIWRNPIASSSLARLSIPTSIAVNPAAVITPARRDFASESSPAIRTVVVRGPTVPALSVAGKGGVERLQHA